MKRIVIVVTAAATMLVLALPAQALSLKHVGFNSVPGTLPGNVPSVGFQATQSAELGDAIQFGNKSSNKLKSATVVMSSWGCEAGAWYSNDCVTTAGATFSEPITLNVYAETAGPGLGALITSKTQTFNIPFRPSLDATNCTGGDAGKWFNAADSTCYNGKATKITFTFANVQIPTTKVVYGIAYNTSGYGASPYGYSNPCNSTAQGCGYDSLNVGAAAGVPAKGTDLALNGIFYNSATGGNYCDGGTGGTGTFRLDDGCWTGYNPMVSFSFK